MFVVYLTWGLIILLEIVHVRDVLRKQDKKRKQIVEDAEKRVKSIKLRQLRNQSTSSTSAMSARKAELKRHNTSPRLALENSESSDRLGLGLELSLRSSQKRSSAAELEGEPATLVSTGSVTRSHRSVSSQVETPQDLDKFALEAGAAPAAASVALDPRKLGFHPVMRWTLATVCLCEFVLSLTFCIIASGETHLINEQRTLDELQLTVWATWPLTALCIATLFMCNFDKEVFTARLASVCFVLGGISPWCLTGAFGCACQRASEASANKKLVGARTALAVRGLQQ